MDEFFADTAIEIDYQLNETVWTEAGLRYAQYAGHRRKTVQQQPRRLLADVLVGAHALCHADQLMTFDTNRFAYDFSELRLIRTPVQ